MALVAQERRHALELIDMLFCIDRCDHAHDIHRIVSGVAELDRSLEGHERERRAQNAGRGLGVSERHAGGEHEIGSELVKCLVHLLDVPLRDGALVNEHVRRLLDGVAAVRGPHPEAQAVIAEHVYHRNVSYDLRCERTGAFSAPR